MMAPSTCGFSACQDGVVGLRHGDEVAAQEHPRDAGQVEQRAGQRAAFGRVRRGEVGRAAAHHVAAGQELQGGGIGRAFGLDEHGVDLSLLVTGKPDHTGPVGRRYIG